MTSSLVGSEMCIRDSATTIQRCYNRFRITTGIQSAELMKLDYVDGLRESYLSATKIQSAFRM
eukprot:8251245-Prorocentrum_lima.AAC.1